MLKIRKVEVFARPERFGIEHSITLEDTPDAEKLKKDLGTQSGIKNFTLTQKGIKFSVGENDYEMAFPSALDDLYTPEVNEAWQSMVANAVGCEEPYRFFVFKDASGNFIGAISYRHDYESNAPIVTLLKRW